MKVSGSYESVVRGVSEQVPQDRRSGQHEEQINLINDPVRGAARRHGSITQDEQEDALNLPTLKTRTNGHRAVTFYVGGVSYDLVMSTVGSGPIWAFNRSARKFIPVVTEVSPVVNALIAGGLSAATNIGKYLILAGNSIVPQWLTIEKWDTPDNAKWKAVWVRGGAYSRTFRVKLTKTDGTEQTLEYKTKSSSYPELLDTSDISASDDYQKRVNDRVYAYNSAATKWIGEAAEDITPENIAEKLRALAADAGYAVTRSGSTLVFSDARVSDIRTDDSGDQSLMHAVGQEVTAPELVSTVHYAGKVVRVRPKRSNNEDAFYLEAIPQDGAVKGGITEVYWRETAGTITKPYDAFAVATVVDDTLYIGSSVGWLEEQTGFDDVPSLEQSAVGDAITAPVPYFLGKRIDYLGVFQDRLVIGCDAVLLFSRTGDYFNWFRQSVLTVQDDDPVEQFALGSENDVITASASFNRDLVFFGNRYWYSVTGASPLTPKSNGVVILREEPNANAVAPKASDNFVFYCKQEADELAGVSKTRLHQMQAGFLADSPEGTNISQQLDNYLRGEPVEVVAFTSPNVVFLRTDASRQEVYTYTYLDAEQGGQRLFDAWSKWRWDTAVGDLVALSRDKEKLLAYVVRQGSASSIVACEEFSLSSALSARPYLDALRPYATIGSLGGKGDVVAVAYGASSSYAFSGASLSLANNLIGSFGGAGLWAGAKYEAVLTPTNPYKRDRNGNAILSGRLTLSSVQISVADTGGFSVSVSAFGYSKLSREFNGRVIGSPDNRIGRQPITSTIVSAVIGREIRECSYTIRSKDWLPLTVTSIDWTGQWFNNTRR